jgi:2-succinyl-6-hydroxy-2,4-cyclohexadiene-1-carboxylate synthase
MATVAVNGIDLNYRDVGEGQAVVLVHGFTGNSRNWALTVPALRDRFRCVSVDLRGHGVSSKPTQQEDYTLETMAEDVVALLDHLGITECVLVGHSMGGMVSQYVTLSRLELVKALVLVDTAAEVPRTLLYTDRINERQRMVEVAKTQGMEAVFDEQLKLNPQREMLESNPAFMQTWREQFLMTSADAYAHCAHGMATRGSLLEELGSVESPTLVVCGEWDEPFVDPSHRMHEAIPGSELVIIEGAGHSPQIETPEKFNEVLQGFLAKVAQPAQIG